MRSTIGSAQRAANAFARGCLLEVEPRAKGATGACQQYDAGVDIIVRVFECLV